MREFFPLPPQYERWVTTSEGRWRLETGNVPDLASRDLLFKLLMAGVKPEERASHVSGNMEGALVGEIAAVGDAVTRWNPLDRALLVPGSRQEGIPLAGVAEFVHVVEETDDFRAFRLPERMNAEDATLLPSAALAARILRKAALPKGGRLLVVGLGLVGQILILLARHQRVEHLIGADPRATLRAKAEWSGATGLIHIPEESIRDGVSAMTRGQGVDGAVILSPEASWTGEASRVISERGSLLVAAEFPPGFTLSVAPAWIQRSEIRIQGVRGFRDRDVREAMRAIDQGILNAESFVSKWIPWKELKDSNLDTGYWAHATQVVIEGPK